MFYGKVIYEDMFEIIMRDKLRKHGFTNYGCLCRRVWVLPDCPFRILIFTPMDTVYKFSISTESDTELSKKFVDEKCNEIVNTIISKELLK